MPSHTGRIAPSDLDEEEMTMGRLSGKVAIITGAARGLGEQIARLFANEGARVALLDLRDEEGAAVARDIGGAALYRHCDVSSERDWEAAIEAVLAWAGRLDVLVNNAAVLPLDSIENTRAEDYERLFRVNELGVFLGVRSAIAPMRAAGGGSIINISSVDAAQPSPATAAYSGTKFAIEGITRVAALELAVDGIRVNGVNAGFGSKQLLMDASGGFVVPEAVMEAHERPDDLRAGARTILFLASDESSIMTGTHLAADHGYTAGKA
jgi:3alpha(or 20beta)-hydroxysteroid dehydrogenase